MNGIIFKKIFIIIFLCFYTAAFFYSNDIDASDDPIMIMEGKSIDIIGTKRTSQDIKTIEKNEIDRYGSQDLTNLLENAFNLSIKKYGAFGSSSTVNIRGNNGKKILILINGIPMNSIQSGDVDLNTIPLYNIEKIELISGGSDSKFNYSGADGGVINIITEKKNDANLYCRLDISNLFYYPGFYYDPPFKNGKYCDPTDDDEKDDYKYFSRPEHFFDTQRAVFNYGIGNKTIFYDFTAGVNLAQNHYQYIDSKGIRRIRKNNEVFDSSIKTSLSINLPYYMRIIASGNYYYAKKNTPGSITYYDPGKRIENIGMCSLFFDANCVGSDRIDTELTVSYKNDNDNYCDKTGGNNHNLHNVRVINKWGVFITDWFKFSYGGDLDFNYLDSDNIGKMTKLNGGGYTNFDFSIFKVVEILPSIKINYYKDYPIIIPKLGLVFNIGEYFALKGNIFRTYVNPSINDLYWPKDDMGEGNPDLKPEIGVGGDIILEYNRSRILSASSSLYVNYNQDVILWDQDEDDGVYRPQNIGKVLFFGSDNTLKTDFVKWFQFTLSYSFQYSFVLTEYHDEEYTFESDKRMPYNPEHIFGIGVVFNWDSGNININCHMESSKYTDVDNSDTMPPFFNLNFSISQKILKLFTVYASVQNVCNNFYSSRKGYPLPNGSITVGFKIDFDYKFEKKEEEIIENEMELKRND